MLFLISAAMLAAQTPAATASPTPSEAEEAAAEKMVCKKEIVTGSRSRTKRTCMTQREWNKLHDQTRDAVHEHIRRSTAGAPSTSG
jgi:hypothetical protein